MEVYSNEAEAIDRGQHDPRWCLLQVQGANYLTNPKCPLRKVQRDTAG